MDNSVSATDIVSIAETFPPPMTNALRMCAFYITSVVKRNNPNACDIADAVCKDNAELYLNLMDAGKWNDDVAADAHQAFHWFCESKRMMKNRYNGINDQDARIALTKILEYQIEEEPENLRPYFCLGINKIRDVLNQNLK